MPPRLRGNIDLQVHMALAVIQDPDPLRRSAVRAIRRSEAATCGPRSILRQISHFKSVNSIVALAAAYLSIPDADEARLVFKEWQANGL